MKSWAVGTFHFEGADYIGVYETGEPFEVHGAPTKGPPCICRMFGNGTEWQGGLVEARATLIAKAPAMLALLRKICDEVESPAQLINAITDASELIADIRL